MVSMLAVVFMGVLPAGMVALSPASLADPGIVRQMPIPPPLPPQRAHEDVFAAVALGDWARARTLASARNDPLLGRVVDWIRLTSPGEKISFSEIAAFLGNHPDWPDRARMRLHGEMAMGSGESDRVILDWFAEAPPRTSQGAERLAAALQRAGRHDEARQIIREAWITMNFAARDERAFLRAHRASLDGASHDARLDRLLWDGRSWEARRMLNQVSPTAHALGVARMRLAEQAAGVDWAIRQIPDAALFDPGFVYERLRWRRARGRDDEAIALLHAFDAHRAALPESSPLPHAERWWQERGTLARRALRAGNISLAYDLAAGHGQTGGASMADAEWLSGWIALIFLEDAPRAAIHFETLHDQVRFPVSVARGAYWAGRAAEGMKDSQNAREWYLRAASHATTFYGQLALKRLENASPPPLAAPPPVEAAEREHFASREVVRAARLIAGSHDPAHKRSFIRHLARQAETPSEHALAAWLAEETQRRDLSLLVAREAINRGVTLIEHGWPTPYLPGDLNGLDPSILFALMRQESGFNIDALSWAGARGLMQVMPATAQEVARSLGVPFSRERLSTDPEYNMMIGTTYLDRLLTRFDGSVVLALAAYNAGPGRVQRWLREHGDFRNGEIDTIDWIESIPFQETRNYVQRVVENLVIYRAMRSGEGVRPEQLARLSARLPREEAAALVPERD